jgi:hypothetical protein
MNFLSDDYHADETPSSNPAQKLHATTPFFLAYAKT